MVGYGALMHELKTREGGALVRTHFLNRSTED
jgi:hypothetical protein